MNNTSSFFDWFFQEFLPPLLPWITAAAIVLEVIFWLAVAFGVGALGKKILTKVQQRRRARAEQ